MIKQISLKESYVPVRRIKQQIYSKNNLEVYYKLLYREGYNVEPN